MNLSDKELERMHEQGVISDKEYIEKDNLLKEKKEEWSPPIEEEPAKEEINKKSDFNFFIAILIIIILFVGFFSFAYFTGKPKIVTFDELHEGAISGSLDEDEGYVYNGYSFILVDDLWYTNVQTVDGEALFNIPLHFGPRDLENIPISGILNLTSFSNSKEVFMTFNPLGNDFAYVALATGELDQTLLKVFGKIPIGSCDRKGIEICETRPVITCNTTRQPVFYVLESDETKVTYDDNCIIMEGGGLEIVKSADRVLLDLLGIMNT